MKKLSFKSAYAKFSLVLLAITVFSLIPQYLTTLITKPGEMSLQLFVHGVAFLAWYVLFSVQAGLIAAGQRALHKKLGYASIAFAAFLIVSGAAMLLGTMSSAEQEAMGRHSFVWAIFHTLISFSTFYILAVVYRKRPQVHRRLMLLASLSMMAASITRFAYLPVIPIDGTAFTLLLSYALVLTPLVIDRVQDGKIHPVLKVGVPIYLVTQLVAMGVMPATALGRSLAFPF